MNASESTTPISAQDLRMLGLNNLAYVKPIKVDGRRAYAIHAADGTQVSIMADHGLAFATIRQNNLEPLSVH